MMLTTIALTFLAAFPVLQEELPLAAERRELAEIRVLLGADRDYAAGKERLAALAEALASSTDPDAAALAADVARLAAEVRRALGEAVPASFASASQDKVDDAVRAAIERGDFAFIRQLGARSGPALAAAVAAEPERFPGDPEADLLTLLLRVDLPGADALLGRMLEHDGFLWKKRVVRALAVVAPWSTSTKLWSTDVPQRWLGPGIQRTLEALAREPELGNDALELLGRLVRLGAPADAFLATAADALRSSDKARRDAAKKAVEPLDFAVSGDVLERLLREPDVDLRVFAATLLRQACNDVLLGLADDPERAVRTWVAARVQSCRGDGIDAAETRALARLVADTDAQVREQALDVLASLPKERRVTVVPAAEAASGREHEHARQVFADPLPDDVYRAALERADARDRRNLVQVAKALPEPVCFELFEALAADPDARVVENVVGGIDGLPFWSDPEGVLRVQAVLLANPAAVPYLRAAHAELDEVGGTRRGLVALVRWLLAHPDVEVADVKLDWSALARADAELFAGYAAHRFERSAGELGDRLQPVDPDALLALARDAARPLPLRLVALARAASDRSSTAEVNAAARAAAEELLAEPGWGALERDTWGWLEDEVATLVGRLPDAHRNPVLGAMIANARFPAWLMPHALGQLEARLAGAAEIGRFVLDRWFAAEGTGEDPAVGGKQRLWAVRRALSAMAAEPQLRDDALLAAATRRPDYAGTAWSVIRDLRDPAFLPLIREAVEAGAGSAPVTALLGYMSDEAAELLLLAAARTTDAELRDQCLAHIEKIREYQDARERWATRKVRTATREQVVAELVAQLGDRSDDVKVQAIRALATWEAVEAMPRLIELTRSGSKAVAAAAREALDRLNARDDG